MCAYVRISVQVYRALSCLSLENKGSYTHSLAVRKQMLCIDIGLCVCICRNACAGMQSSCTPQSREERHLNSDTCRA